MFFDPCCRFGTFPVGLDLEHLSSYPSMASRCNRQVNLASWSQPEADLRPWQFLNYAWVPCAISGTWKTWIGGYGAWFTRSPNLSKQVSSWVHTAATVFRWSQGPYGHGYISSDMHVEIAFPRIFLFVRFRWFLGIDRLKCNMSTI